MARNRFTYEDVADLRDCVGSAVFARGLTHAREFAIGQLAWYPDELALEGDVEGSSGVRYDAVAYFADNEGRLGLASSDCTCPFDGVCKHVVALVLTAMHAIAPARPAPPAVAVVPAPPATPAWERSLRPLLPPEPGDHEWHTGANPLAIELTLVTATGADTRPSVLAKPVKRGRTGWISGGLTWTSVTALHASSGHPAEHVRLLKEFYAVYSSGRHRHSYYHFGDEKTIDLATFDSRQLWPLLDELTAAGVQLVYARKDTRTVRHSATAEFCLDFRATEFGLTITPIVRVDGTAASPLAVGFIGTTGHGVVHAEQSNRFQLARFPSPVPPRLQQMVIDGQQIDIPAAEQSRFVIEYFPTLTRSATITSSDESFTPPTVSDPRLALRATYADEHSLTVDWEWAYRIGEHEVRAPLDPRGGGTSFRDPARERQLLEGLDLPPDSSAALAAHSQLAGIDTMRFTTELLPLLASDDDVQVEVVGTPPDYREAGDSLRIGLSTTASAANSDWFDLGLSISVEGQEVPFADVFTALARQLTHLLLPSGAYFSLEKPELQTLKRLIEEARELQDTPGGGLRISRFQAGLWDEFSQLGIIESQAAEWQNQVEGLLTLDSIESAPSPRGLKAQLRPYQVDGFRWLTFLWTHNLGGILADDMGLGKTVQSLALICHAREQKPADAPFLIVAPTSVVPNWAAECARFAPHLDIVAIDESLAKLPNRDRVLGGADVVVTSYARFRIDYEKYAELPWSALILDEAQFVKNNQSKAYVAVRALPVPFKLAITGTPMENNLGELWSLLSITAPGLFPSLKKFGEYYRKPIEKQGDRELLAQLRRRIRPLVLRRNKEQVAADLPAKQEQVLELDLHPRHQKLYQTHLQRERQKILGLIDDMDRNRFTIFRSLTLLRQLSLDASLVDDTVSPGSMPSAKVDALADQLHDVVDGGHRALVFSQFTGFLATVRKRLEAEGVRYCYLDGSTRDRAAVVEEFKSGSAPVFLISLKAGGFGLNLTEADYVFLMDPWWNPATEAQAVDRTHRIGQTRNVMVYRLISRNTIEEKVMALKAKKASLFSSVLDADSMLSASLTADDIRGLFE
ncbi:DEAD/DEAH box helicase [Antrihabitans sp. YC2-6]|uniref:DEAD/DEAH box helicase n=1 Tax=Antrihabitans sp. YC2-6 TaxID=2799498 RepID=UPI0018F5C093|nr:DEAD/DEAH box helicase [Antrihabitans sp. YC2-6]MBJ8348043.1 helicase [Antrihabitans sp. YC2-6]